MNTLNVKKWENMIYNEENNQLMENNQELTQVVELTKGINQLL